MLDPNWFYSSLAQCAAAIVGLLGAVMIARLQNQVADLQLTMTELRQLVSPVLRDAYLRRSEVAAFEAFAADRILLLKTSLAEGKDRVEVSAVVDLFGMASSTGHFSTEVSEAIIQALEKDLSLAAQLRGILTRVLDITEFAAPAEVGRLHGDLREIQARLPVVQQSRLGQIVQPMPALENGLAARRAKASVRVPAVMTGIVAWLCLAGLVWPLASLSAYSTGGKVTLLAAFTVGLSAIPALMAYQMKQIRRVATRRSAWD